MDSAERASRPSSEQLHLLVEFLESNPSLAKGFPKVPSARVAVRKSWDKLTNELNSLEGCHKSARQWIKYWADKKSGTKKKAALLRSRVKSQVSLESELTELSDLEERILVLMSAESYAVDDRHLKINDIKVSGSPDPLTESPEPKPSRDLAGTASPSLPSNTGSHPRRLPSRLRLLPNEPWSSYTQQAPYTSGRRMRGKGQSLSLFTSITERLIRIEEQRIQLDRRNSELLEAFLNRETERDHSLGQAIETIGDVMKLLIETLKK